MSGPLTSAVFLLLSCALLPPHRPLLLEAKSLSGSRVPAGVHRLRRELRDALPYEAQMMSYPPAAAGAEGRGGNELYYPAEGWRGQAMGQALQRLAEDDRRRDQEAAYLSGLLRLLGDADGNGPRAGEEDEEEEEEEGDGGERDGPGDFQGPYPPDYDETEPGMNMAKPQAAWQGLLDPQLAQALLNRYRQERLQRANRQQEARRDPATGPREEEVLRYLVGRVLASLDSDATQNAPARLSRRDLGGAAGGDGSGGRVLKRSRRSADPAPLPPNSKGEASLLRVKRLGDEEDKMAAPAAARGGGVGLQRMKRIDADLPQQGSRHVRRRRALTYDPNLLAQRILQYLPQ